MGILLVYDVTDERSFGSMYYISLLSVEPGKLAPVFSSQ
jgi:hypothetical protein